MDETQFTLTNNLTIGVTTMSRRGRKPKNCYNVQSLKSVKTLDNTERSIQKDLVLYGNSQPQPSIEDNKPQPTFIHMLAYLNRFGVKPPKMINKEAYGYYFEIDEATKIVIINNITDSKFSVQWLNNNNHCETLYSEEDLDTNLTQYLKQLRLPTNVIEHVVSEVTNVFYTTNPLEYPTNHTIDDLNNLVTTLATYDNNHSDYRYVTDVVDSEKYDKVVMVAGMDGVTINTVIKNHEIYACAFDSLNSGSDELSKYVDTVPDGILDILYRELLMYDVQQLTHLNTETNQEGVQPMQDSIETNETPVEATENPNADMLVIKDIEDIIDAKGVMGEEGDYEYHIKYAPTKVTFASQKHANTVYLLVGGFRFQIYEESDGESELINIKPLLEQHIKSELILGRVLYDLKQAKAELIKDRHSPERPVPHQQPIIRNMDPVLPANWSMTVDGLFNYCRSQLPATINHPTPRVFSFLARGQVYEVCMSTQVERLIISSKTSPEYVLDKVYGIMPAAEALKNIGLSQDMIVALLSACAIDHNAVYRNEQQVRRPTINPWQHSIAPSSMMPMMPNVYTNPYNTFQTQTFTVSTNMFVQMLGLFEHARNIGSGAALNQLFNTDIETILQAGKNLYPEAGFKVDNVYITYDFDKSVGFVYTPYMPIKLDANVTKQSPIEFVTAYEIDVVTKGLLLNAFWFIILESQKNNPEQKAD